jgi:hypothetical protein
MMTTISSTCRLSLLLVGMDNSRNILDSQGWVVRHSQHHLFLAYLPTSLPTLPPAPLAGRSKPGRIRQYFS